MRLLFNVALVAVLVYAMIVTYPNFIFGLELIKHDLESLVLVIRGLF